MAQLLRRLEMVEPDDPSLGSHSAAQIQLRKTVATEGEDFMAVDPAKVRRVVEQCFDVVDHHGIRMIVPAAQSYLGRHHSIGGQAALCQHRTQMFNKTSMISSLCMYCYKVQILPWNLTSLFQVFFVLMALRLPADNMRKCMLELRENIKGGPYKGYIYTDSEESARDCAEMFRAALADSGVTDVTIGLSHGCSEYGLEYPDFKYAPSGAHREFRRPDDWDARERDYVRQTPLPSTPPQRPVDRGVSLRDVFVFQTWIDYAAIIGDPAVEMFRDRVRDRMPEPFATRVGAQADQRRAELEALAG